MPTPRLPRRSRSWRVLKGTALTALVLLMAACAGPGPGPGPTPRGAAPTSSPSTIFPERDGPGANPPPDLARVPDAEPRVEPIRPGGANKPYAALGQNYVPQTQDLPFRQRGLASWYGRKFHGRRTASGERYDMYAMTAAHPTLPIPSYVRVRNPANDAEVVLRINDRGPFHSDRIMDLSYTAALKLGLLRGTAPVELERITFDDIRSGAWRRGASAATRLAAAPAQTSEVFAALPESAAPVAFAVVPGAAAPVLPEAAPPPAVPAPAVATPDALPAPAAPVAEPAVPPSSVASDMPPQAAAIGRASLPGPAAAVGFWVQLGAFQQRAGAESFHRRVAADVAWLAPLLAVFSEPPLHRLQAGPYASRDEAQSVAQRVREALKLVPVVLERR